MDVDILARFRDVALPCYALDAALRNQSGPEFAHRTKQLLLQDIADGVAGIAGNPRSHGTIVNLARPPIRIAARGMQCRFITASAFRLADSVGGEHQAFAMLKARSEELQMLRVQLPA